MKQAYHGIVYELRPRAKKINARVLGILFKAGESMDDIAAAFGFTRQEVEEAIRFCLGPGEKGWR